MIGLNVRATGFDGRADGLVVVVVGFNPCFVVACKTNFALAFDFRTVFAFVFGFGAVFAFAFGLGALFDFVFSLGALFAFGFGALFAVASSF